MTSFTLQRVDYLALGFGVIASLIAGVVVDPLTAASVASGCGLAVANFLLLRFFAEQLMLGGGRRVDAQEKARWTLLLGAKFVAMLFVIWFVVAVAGVSGIGFATGFASVPVAFLLETMLVRPGSHPQDTSAASKES